LDLKEPVLVDYKDINERVETIQEANVVAKSKRDEEKGIEITFGEVETIREPSEFELVLKKNWILISVFSLVVGYLSFVLIKKKRIKWKLKKEARKYEKVIREINLKIQKYKDNGMPDEQEAEMYDFLMDKAGFNPLSSLDEEL